MTIKSSHSLLLCAIKQAELLHIHQHEYKHATHFHSMHVTHKSSTPLQVYHLTVHVRRRCCCVPQTGNGQKALMIGLIHGRMWSRVFSLDLSTVRKLQSNATFASGIRRNFEASLSQTELKERHGLQGHGSAKDPSTS